MLAGSTKGHFDGSQDLPCGFGVEVAVGGGGVVRSRLWVVVVDAVVTVLSMVVVVVLKVETVEAASVAVSSGVTEFPAAAGAGAADVEAASTAVDTSVGAALEASTGGVGDVASKVNRTVTSSSSESAEMLRVGAGDGAGPRRRW